MEGTVLHFDESTKKGVVRSENGDRYDFTDGDWKSSGTPRAGAKVDFVAKDNFASEIYVISSTSISGKLSEFQASELWLKISALLGNGMHNKFGIIAAVAVLVSLFFPVIEIPFLGKGSLINGGTGKMLFILLIVLTTFFYGGATRLYTRILGGVILGILFIQYYDLFTGLNQANDIFGSLGGRSRNAPNFFNLVRWGAFVNIAACVPLFFATFINRYTNNEKAI